MATADLEAAAAARASVLENIHNMERDLGQAQHRIADLERQVQTAEDRISILAEERARYRDGEKLYRGKLIELATSMANIGLLTMQAQTIMTSVRELEAGEPLPEPEQPVSPPAPPPPRNADDALANVADLLTTPSYAMGGPEGLVASGAETRR